MLEGPVSRLPINMNMFTNTAPRWILMWGLAVLVFGAVKLLSVRRVDPRESPTGRLLGYLLLWPGMDARTFLDASRHPAPPTRRDWALALLKTALGAALLLVVRPALSGAAPLVTGWTGLLGLVYLLHFGSFHLIALLWRRRGVDAVPLFRSPMRATSVAEFWGSRWNLAFSDLTRFFLFRPLTARLGATGALWLSFLASGLVHDLVISIPAGAGAGLPTAYFLLQAAAISVERQFAIGGGVRGWLFTAFVTAAPIALVFHPPFVLGVMNPFFDLLPSIWR